MQVGEKRECREFWLCLARMEPTVQKVKESDLMLYALLPLLPAITGRKVAPRRLHLKGMWPLG